MRCMHTIENASMDVPLSMQPGPKWKLAPLNKSPLWALTHSLIQTLVPHSFFSTLSLRPIFLSLCISISLSLSKSEVSLTKQKHPKKREAKERRTRSLFSFSISLCDYLFLSPLFPCISFTFGEERNFSLNPALPPL